MGKKMILIHKLQGDMEKWNNRIEEKVGEPNFETYRDALLNGPIATIESMRVYQLCHIGEDIVSFTVEEIN
jgi:hypothetical protein